MRTHLKKFGVALAVVVMTAIGTSISTASPAAAVTAPAVTCGPSAPDRDPNNAQIINRDPAFSGPAMRTGPGTNCSLIVRVPWSAFVDLACFRSGDTVNGITTWSAAHYAGHFGWISDFYLSGDGSFFAC
jgi:hypothetical protein